jgi:hypothetical protein
MFTWIKRLPLACAAMSLGVLSFTSVRASEGDATPPAPPPPTYDEAAVEPATPTSYERQRNVAPAQNGEIINTAPDNNLRQNINAGTRPANRSTSGNGNMSPGNSNVNVTPQTSAPRPPEMETSVNGSPNVPSN